MCLIRNFPPRRIRRGFFCADTPLGRVRFRGAREQRDPSPAEASINLGVAPLRSFLGLTLSLRLGGIIGGSILTWITIAWSAAAASAAAPVPIAVTVAPSCSGAALSGELT